MFKSHDENRAGWRKDEIAIVAISLVALIMKEQYYFFMTQSRGLP